MAWLKLVVAALCTHQLTFAQDDFTIDDFADTTEDTRQVSATRAEEPQRGGQRNGGGYAQNNIAYSNLQSIIDLENKMIELSRQISDLEYWKETATRQLQDYERTVVGQEDYLRIAQQRIQALERTNEALQKDSMTITAKFSKVLEFSGMSNGTMQRVAEMEHNVADMLDTVRSLARDNQGQIIETQAVIKKMQGNFIYMFKKVKEMKNNVTLVNENVEKLTDAYGAMEPRLNDAEESAQTNVLKVGQMDSIVDELFKRANDFDNMVQFVNRDKARVCVGDAKGVEWKEVDPTNIAAILDLDRCDFTEMPSVHISMSIPELAENDMFIALDMDGFPVVDTITQSTARINIETRTVRSWEQLGRKTEELGIQLFWVAFGK